ncbi:MAG: sugar-binding protein, partial [Bacteroidia bacterium]|nr:sugar-binding protein [Bacteroidia bacterium]
MKIKAPSISLPKGGGAIKGMGETFQPNSFSGSGSFSIPVPVTPARGFEPKLSLNYSSGSGNGPFGMGFQISIPAISIRTEKGLPKYDGEDRYVISGAEELVPQLDANGKIEERAVGDFLVRQYRPRTEGLFARIERYWNKPGNSCFWKIVTKENRTNIYGFEKAEQIYDSENINNIFQWLLCETFDSHGNSIKYEYKSDDFKNVAASANELNRNHINNKYIKSVRYGNKTPKQRSETYKNQTPLKNDFLFEVVFDYGEHTDFEEAHKQTDTWKYRKDSFSSYRSGFEIRTHRLCKRVLIFHHFDELKQINTGYPFLIKALELNYQKKNDGTDTAISSASFLNSVTVKGYRKFKKNNDEKPKYYCKTLPPLEFTYSTFKPEYDSSIGFKELKVEGSPVNSVLNRSGFQMIDLHGEGISGILYNDEQKLMYWAPHYDDTTKEKVKFVGPVNVMQFPVEKNLQNRNYNLIDVGSDGKLDLLVKENGRMGFYQSEGEDWLPFKNFEKQPVIAHAPGLTEQVDLTGDGFADIVIQEQDTLTFFESLGKRGYDAPVRKTKAADLPFAHSEGECVTVRYADMFGDGLQHKVRITKNSVEVWPNMGYGKFGEKVVFADPPFFGEEFNPKRLLFADIDGTGAGDLVYINYNSIDVYYNDSGNNFAKKISIPAPFQLDELDMVNIADVLGNGTSCILVSGYDSFEQKVKHLYYDFTKGVKPHLLIQTNNNSGAVTRVQYCSSVKYYLKDKSDGKPWITRLHYPVQVIEKTESVDYISESKNISFYSYHHGFYDGEEREFNGFGRVEEVDTPLYEQFILNDPDSDVPFNLELKTNKDLFSPAVKTVTWHHTGAFIENGKIS